MGAAATWLATVLVANFATLPAGMPRVVDVAQPPGPQWAVRLSCDRLE